MGSLNAKNKRGGYYDPVYVDYVFHIDEDGARIEVLDFESRASAVLRLKLRETNFKLSTK